MSYEFEWDKANKDKSRIKHGISTEEAESTFDDIIQLLKDTKHSEKETRFILIGTSNKKRKLFISFTRRGDKIRIISARRMHKKEIDTYEEKDI